MVSFQRLPEKEKEKNICLPPAYKAFFLLCQSSRPNDWLGTDLINDNENLNAPANELLEENGMEIQLTSHDFVFMMHQGYTFWYSAANGNPDPVVYGYFEGKKQIDTHGLLSTFLGCRQR